jgi:hypothetical protein
MKVKLPLTTVVPEYFNEQPLHASRLENVRSTKRRCGDEECARGVHPGLKPGILNDGFGTRLKPGVATPQWTVGIHEDEVER